MTTSTQTGNGPFSVNAPLTANPTNTTGEVSFQAGENQIRLRFNLYCFHELSRLNGRALFKNIAILMNPNHPEYLSVNADILYCAYLSHCKWAKTQPAYEQMDAWDWTGQMDRATYDRIMNVCLDTVILGKSVRAIINETLEAMEKQIQEAQSKKPSIKERMKKSLR